MNANVLKYRKAKTIALTTAHKSNHKNKTYHTKSMHNSTSEDEINWKLNNDTKQNAKHTLFNGYNYKMSNDQWTSTNRIVRTDFESDEKSTVFCSRLFQTFITQLFWWKKQKRAQVLLNF